MDGEHQDPISEPGRVRELPGVYRGWQLLPVRAHVHSTPEQQVSPIVAVLRHQWQPERADAIWQGVEERGRPGEVAAIFAQ